MRRAISLRRRGIQKLPILAGPSAPTFASNPTVAGLPVEGNTLSSTTGAVLGNPTPTVTRQWYRQIGTGSPSAIAGQTGANYVSSSADDGASVFVRVTASNTQGTATADSNSIGPFSVASASALQPFSVTIKNDGASTMAAGATSFAHHFAKGEVAAGQGLTATIDGTPQWAQFDVQRSWSDGSVRTAQITIRRPALIAGASKVVDFAAGSPPAQTPLDVAALLTGRTITLDITGVTIAGSAATIPQIDIRQKVLDAIAAPDTGANNPTYWHRGPNIVTVCVPVETISGNTAFNNSGMRLLFDVTIAYDGTIDLDYTASNDRVFESWTTGKGRFDATHSLSIDGQQKTSQAVWLSLYRTAHWEALSDATKPVFQSALRNLNIVQPMQRLINARAILPYDTGYGPTENFLKAYQDNIDQNPNWMRPLYSPSFPDYASSTGELQFGSQGGGNFPNMSQIPTAMLAYLRTGDIRAMRAALAWAELPHSLPMHCWDNIRKRYLDRSFYYRLSSVGLFNNMAADPSDAGTDFLPFMWPTYPPNPGTTPEGITLWFDHQHVPTSLGCIGYILTGRARHYRNLMAMASIAQIISWNADGHHDPFYTTRYDIFLMTNVGPGVSHGPDAARGWMTTRDIAWQLMAADNADFFGRDGSHYATYWKSLIDVNLDAWHRTLPNLKAEQGGNAADALQGYNPIYYSGSAGDGKTTTLFQLTYLNMAEGSLLRRRMMEAPSDTATSNALEMWDFHIGFRLLFAEGVGGVDWRNGFMRGLPLFREWDGYGSGGWGSAYTSHVDWYKSNEPGNFSRIQTCSELADIIANHWPEPVAPDLPDGGGMVNYSRPDYNENQWDNASVGGAFGMFGLAYKMYLELGNTTKAARQLVGYNLAVNQVPQFLWKAASFAQMRDDFSQYSFTLADAGITPFTNEHIGRNDPLPPVPVVTAPTISAVMDAAPVGYVIATLTATGSPWQWTLSAQSVAGAMAIDATGKLTVANTSAFAYATRTSITANVTATNDGGDSTAVGITVPIYDGKPVVTAGTFSIHEHAPTAASPLPLTVGTVIGQIEVKSATSPTVSIASQNPTGGMDLGTTTAAAAGVWNTPLRVLDPTLFDIETRGSLTADVTATNPKGTSASARQTVNLINVVEPGDPVPKLLDTLSIPSSTVWRAWGPLKLFIGYSGPAMKVYRSSDGTSQDIGFDSSGHLDWTALTAFVGSNRGTFEWYDQATGALMPAATAANRPYITGPTGGRITFGGGASATRSAVQFDSAQSHMLRAAGLTVPNRSKAACITVMSELSGGSARIVDFGPAGDFSNDSGAADGWLPLYTQSGNNYFTQYRGGAGVQHTGVPGATPIVASVTYERAAPYLTIRVNGVQTDALALDVGPLAATGDITIGGKPGGISIEFASMKMGPVILLSQFNATDLATIENGLKSYYGF